MRDSLLKYMKYNDHVDMMYMSNDGQISQRRIKVLAVSKESFKAYCFLRGSTRIFNINNVLALIPVIHKEKILL